MRHGKIGIDLDEELFIREIGTPDGRHRQGYRHDDKNGEEYKHQQLVPDGATQEAC